MTAGPVEQLRDGLAQAGDAQIARVVAMVDAMPDRGAADGLIDPLRPRLAQLRPARPVTFTRLLFTPLDPVVFGVPEWQRGGAVGIPRPALAPLATAVRAALPDDGFWQGYTKGHGETGAALWPAAASALDALDMPPDWPNRSGLPIRHFATVAAAAATVLHEATLIELLVNRRRPADEKTLRAMLSRSKSRGSTAMDTLVAVLLARLPAPARILALAEEVSGVDRATEQTLDRLGYRLSQQAESPGTTREAASELARLNVLLSELEPNAPPTRRASLETLRGHAEGFCRRTFSQAVAHTVTLAEKAGATPTDSAVAGMEAAARDLRRLETEARKIGNAAHYEALLAQASAAIQGKTAGMSLADRVRMVEILAGPEAALTLLDAAAS